ncbi:MAG: cysteine desulfurase [Bacteroidetes bacterium]|nr:cysteine desulfurase [Bacteroidota bacterium]
MFKEKSKSTKLNIELLRKDFPILSREVNGKPLVYLDNAATSQKPQAVIDAIVKYYSFQNSNIHRGVHYLSQYATAEYETAREKVKAFINAPHSKQCIFTKGTTDAINLVSNGFGRKFLNAGDEVIISGMEHHSNIVPWQMICEEKGAILKVIPIDDNGDIIMEEFDKLLNERVKIISICHVSNALGTINPVKEIIQKAHKLNIPVMLDGAQAVHHMKVDVQELDVDLYAFSSHKMFGPTGLGVLYGKEEFLNKMAPYQGGGDMIKTVSFEKTEYNELPHKFEAGTPNIEAGIALGVAIDYINAIGIENINAYENELLQYATEKLSAIEGLKIIGTAKEKAGVVSFKIEGIHPYDIGIILDKLGIAIRTGHHCTQPLMARFNIPGTARASFAFYNTKDEVDTLVKGIEKAKAMLG